MSRTVSESACKGVCSLMHLCESKVFCNPPLPFLSLHVSPTPSSVLYHSHHHSYLLLSALLPFSHTHSLFLSFSPPLSLYSHFLLCLCMRVCVLWAASQDDGEVRAALGTSSQWRGLRPRDALAAISQGSPVIASPDGLQVALGKRIDRQILSPYLC